MNLIVELSKKIFHEIKNLNLTGAEKYELIMAKYEDFTKTYPLIVKYMCFYNFYHPQLFLELVTELDKGKKYEATFEFQANYVKKLLVYNGMNKMEAKKTANKELYEITNQIKKIKKQEIKIKKQIEEEKKQNIEELRNELLDFAKNL